MNDYDKRLAEASKTLGGNVIKMIGLILQKHDAAVIEASMEAIEAAVAAEREACAKLVEDLGIDGYGTLAIAAAIRQRSKK
jgi:protein-disulfide isomerase-like protein with CxxC motif